MIEKALLTDFIDESKLYLSEQELAPHDYPSLKTDIVQAELQKTIEDLDALLELEDDVELKERFKELCAMRAVEHEDSCLSFFAAPKGASNQLYWAFLIHLYEPGDLGEALAILAPNITGLVMSEAYVKEKPAIGRNIGFHFKEVPIGELPKEPANLERLSSLVVSGNQLFDPLALKSLTFIQHQSLKESFDEAFPNIAEQTYQHNHSLKALSDDLETVSGDGQGLKRSLEILNRDLRLGGTHMTGGVYATLDASTAFTEFKAYLARLPEEMKASFLALTGRDKTLNDVMQHLDRGDCVEIAAGDIKDIIDNPANQEFLSRHPLLSEAGLAEIHKRYGKKAPLATHADDSTSKLPVVHLEKAMTKITILDVHDCLSLLISFSPDFYPDLFKCAGFHGNNRRLFKHLSTRISEGVLNAEQKQALTKAVWANRERFGKAASLFFILECGEEIEPYLQALTRDGRVAALKAKNRFEHTVFHLSADKPESLIKVLDALPEGLVLDALADKGWIGRTVFHLAANNPVSLSILFDAIPQDMRAALAQGKDDGGQSVVHLAANNPESLCVILDAIPKDIFLALAQEKDKGGYAALHYAASDHESLSILLTLCPRAERLDAVKEKNSLGDTVFHLAASNPESLRIILALYPLDERLAALKEKNSHGNSVLQLAASNPESLIIILAFLPADARLAMLIEIDAFPAYKEVVRTYMSPYSLRAALEHYIAVRRADPRETYLPTWLTFLGGGFTKTDELNAARYLIQCIDGEDPDIQPIHLRALKQGGLGKIIADWQTITGSNVEAEFVPAEVVLANQWCSRACGQ